MPRKNKRQRVNFPQEPLPSDAELDSLIDGGTAPVEGIGNVTVAPSIRETQRKNKEKKEAQKIAAEIPQVFTPEQCEWVFDIYVGALCFVFSILLKTEWEPLFAELKFEEEDKKSLSKPLAKIASKYSPASWAANTAEIELVVSLGMYTVMSFGRAKTVAKKEREKKEAEKRNGVNRNTVTQNSPQNHVAAAPVVVPL